MLSQAKIKSAVPHQLPGRRSITVTAEPGTQASWTGDKQVGRSLNLTEELEFQIV